MSRKTKSTEFYQEPSDFDTDASSQYFAPSKSQLKRDMHDLQGIGVQLVGLSKEQLEQLSLPEKLLDTVKQAQKSTAREGKRRLLQYIGKLMRHVDTAPILAKFKEWEGESKEHIEEYKRIERARDRLLDNDDYFTSFMKQYPSADAQHLRTLVRSARKEIETNRLLQEGQTPQRKHFRAIFQEIKHLMTTPIQAQSTENDDDSSDE